MVDLIKYRGFDHISWYIGDWFYWLIGGYFMLPVVAYLIIPHMVKKRSYGNKKSITIFVLGDLGHSPRMNYHAKSFAQLDYYVNLCGYIDTHPSNDIIDDANIEIHPIVSMQNRHKLPFVLFAITKILNQIKQLISLLFEVKRCNYILIQNPPSVPLLMVVIIFIKLYSKNTKLIIDWHNLNFSILNLRYNNLNHPFVKIMKFYEYFFAKYADLHFTVTEKMKNYLVHEFNINSKKIITLYDRPDAQFQPLSIPKQKIINSFDIFRDIFNLSNYKILISSTSFTPDEDFTILLKALKKYESLPNLPPICLIITGKGPLKNQFLSDVINFKFSDKIIIKTAWLPINDYPKLLSIADLGISLHTSSSGIDLPMKIVDMFGCGIPVISLNFPAIDELVLDGSNGLVCKESSSQPDEICRLLQKSFTDDNLYKTIKLGAMNETNLRWQQNWNQKLRNYFD